MSARPPAGPAPQPARQLVVMGVSGTGKTTVARALAERLARVFIEGDGLHPARNIERMSAGLPLDDDDRRPWLEALAALLASHHADHVSTVTTCSALKRAYRDVLRSGLPDDAVSFVHLAAPFEVLRARMEARVHFMPPSLLRSQLDALEPLGPDETGGVFDATAPVDEVVAGVLEALRDVSRGEHADHAGS